MGDASRDLTLLDLELQHFIKFILKKSQYYSFAGRIQISGIINNVSPQARVLNIDPLGRKIY
jgi:hypothetical protein